MMIWIFIKTR